MFSLLGQISGLVWYTKVKRIKDNSPSLYFIVERVEKNTLF